MSESNESPAPQPPGQEPPPPSRPQHRSVADGELVNTWTLKDYFASLNSVLRLPQKPRPRPKPKSEGEPKAAFSLPSLSGIRLPKMVVSGAVVLSLAVLVVRPLMLSASRGGTEGLAPVVGVWEAGSGRYAGRMFELGLNSIAFRTSAKSPEYTWHPISSLVVKPDGDSTLFTLSYEQDGKQAEFGFWLIPGKDPVIRVTHQQGTTWKKTPYEPIARPR